MLVPGQHECERQVVDRAAEGVRESECNLDGAVGIVALPDIEDARDTVDLAEVKVVKAEFAAGEGEDERVHRCALDELRVVIAPRVRTVAAADEKDVLDGTAFDGLDDLRRLREDCRVGKAGSEHVTAVDAAHAAVGLIAAEGKRLLDDGGEVLAALRVLLNMSQPPVADDRGGIDAVSVALTRRHDAVGGEKDGCGEIGKLLLLILPRRAEVASEMGVFVQTRIAVRGQHLAVCIDVDALSGGLLEELMQVLKVVTGNDDERSFLNIGVNARGHRIAEGRGVRAVKQRHALEIHLAEFGDEREPFRDAVLLCERGKPLVEPRAHRLVLAVETHGMVCVGGHALEPEEQRGAQRHQIGLAAPEP